MATVTALHDDQRLGRKALFRQVGTRPAGVGTVGDRLPGPGGGEHLGTQALQVHVGARDLLPVCHTAGWRKIEVIGMHRDALGKLPGQLCRQRGFAAAAPAVQRHQYRGGRMGREQSGEFFHERGKGG